MALEITHAFTSAKADGTDTTLVQPSNWNEAHDITMATSRILGRVTSGSGAAEELTADDAWEILGIVSGTNMLFQQTTAPTGWTKQTAHNNKALRLVSGTASSGGTNPFTTAFNAAVTSSSTVLTTAQLPAHTHTDGTYAVGTSINNGSSVARGLSQDNNNISYQSGGANATLVEDMDWSSDTLSLASGAVSGVSGETGSGSGHTHTTNVNVQYVDVIIAAKD